MRIVEFVVTIFIVSALSDIILNLLSNNKRIKEYNLKIILSLKPYFKNKTIIQSAIYAGVTIVTALLINMLLSKNILGYYLPHTIIELFKFIFIAFPLGYIIDILIYENKIFGNSLDLYYKVAGAGLWGALAYVFSIVISYLLAKLFQ